MPKFGRKTIKKAINVTEIFLKVAEYIDEEGNPTDKADGMLAVDTQDNLIILRPGAKRFDRMMKSNVSVLNYIASLPYLKDMTTEELRQHLINQKMLET